MGTFIVNPVAAACPPDIGSRIARRFTEALVWFTEAPGDAGRLGRRALAESPGSAVVACGGDGTFREVASAVGDQAPVGFLPLGTINLVANELGIPANLEGALRVVEEGRATRIYGGRCVADDGPEAGLFFIGVTAGPDADAVHAVRPSGKNLMGRYAYALEFLKRLARPIRPDVAYTVGGTRHRCVEFMALKIPHYAGKYRISERCSLFDPTLELIAAERGRGPLIRLFWNAFRSRVEPIRGVARHEASEAQLVLPVHGRFQMDGDPFHARRLRLSVDPRPLTVLAGAPAAP